MILFELECFFIAQQYLEILYKTIFCLGYYGLMRVGELAESNHVVKACNIHIGQNKDKIMLVLYSSKTHGKRHCPQKIKISALPKVGTNVSNFFCPFQLIRSFLRIRGEYANDEEQFFIFRDKSPVTPVNVRSVLRTMLKHLNLDSSKSNTHSLRSGRTSDLYKMGIPIEKIRCAGRWRSNTVYKYIHL